MAHPLVIASDHAGYSLKLALIDFLKKKGVAIEDLGCPTEASVDYPDFALRVAQKVSEGKAERGILVCGTGVGVAITANKSKGVRAASITDLYTAKMARSHNDLNVLCLGARVVGLGLACELVDAFLGTPFEGGRHEARVKKIEK